MWKRIEGLANIALAVAAVIMAVSFVRRERRVGGPTADASAIVVPAVQWSSLLSQDVSHHRGSHKGVQLVEFVDLECPFCARHYRALKELWLQDSSGVSFRFVHYPLPMHRFAMPAARAAECAGEEGKFFAFVDIVFEKQDSLGLKTFASFARDAGVIDTTRIDQCARSRELLPRIMRGISLAESLRVRGTPTLFAAGKEVTAHQDAGALSALLDSLKLLRAP